LDGGLEVAISIEEAQAYPEAAQEAGLIVQEFPNRRPSYRGTVGSAHPVNAAQSPAGLPLTAPPNPDRRRALELLASCRVAAPRSCSRNDFTIPQMVELVRAGWRPRPLTLHSAATNAAL
jgi:hypothetical protein